MRHMSPSGKPSNTLKDDSHTNIRALLKEEQRLTIREIKWLLKERFHIKISTFTISQILKEMEMNKVTAQWVPHELERYRTKRMGAALDFLTQYAVIQRLSIK